MLGRRSFLIGCGGAVAAPAFAKLGLPLAANHPAQSRAAGPPVPSWPAALGDPESIALRIDGWDTPDDSASAANSEMWVRVNSSWRAVWR
jgi:hypothetical protein